MTSKCKHRGDRSRDRLALLLAVLAGAFAVPGQVVLAQNDGAQMPPPPRLKQRQADAPDADFPSPLKGQDVGQQSDDARAQRLREMVRRRRQLRDSQAGGGQGAGFGQGGGFGQGAGTGAGAGFGQGAGAGLSAGGRFRQGAGPGAGGRFRQGAGLGAGAGFGQGQGLGGGAGFGQGAGQGNGGGMPALAGARQRQGMQMGVPGQRRALDLTPLNLSDDQKQRIRQLRTANRERARDARQNVQQKVTQLHSLLFSADAPEGRIRDARHQLRQAQEQLDDINLEDLLGIRRVLTAEQRQKLPGLAPPAGGGLGPGGGQALGAGFRGGGNAGFGGGQRPQQPE